VKKWNKDTVAAVPGGTAVAASTLQLNLLCTGI